MAEESLKHKTKKGIYWTFFNQFTNNGLSFVVSIIMARLLSPSDYGITALPEIFLAVAQVFIGAGFGTALVRKPDLKECDLSTAFIYSISVGVFCYLVIFVCAPFIAGFYNTPVLTRLVRITALNFLWSPLATPQSIILQRRLDFKTPARIAIVTNIIGAVTGISVAYLGYGLWALVIMGVVSSFLSTFLTWLVVRWRPITGFSKDSFQYLWGFGNKLMASTLLDKVYNNITPLIVGKFYSTSQLGVYKRALGYASLPAEQGTRIIQSVTFPILSKVQDDNDILATSYRRMLKVSSFVIFPVMMLLSALAEPVIVILVTEKWIDSVIFLRILCFSMMWYPIHAMNLSLLQVKGRSDWFLRLEIWKKGLGLTVMACTLPFGLIYFVIAGVISSFISLFINTYYTGKLINMGFTKQMKDLIPTYFLSLAMFIVVLGINQFITNLWSQVILGGFVGVIFYLGVSYLFHFSELKDVMYMLNVRHKTI